MIVLILNICVWLYLFYNSRVWLYLFFNNRVWLYLSFNSRVRLFLFLTSVCDCTYSITAVCDYYSFTDTCDYSYSLTAACYWVSHARVILLLRSIYRIVELLAMWQYVVTCIVTEYILNMHVGEVKPIMIIICNY